MNPETHLLASWLIGAKATRNARDCALVAWAGILPDVDGIGLLVDAVVRLAGHPGWNLYERYHHYLLHGVLGGAIVSLALCFFARDRWRVAILTLIVFHLHLFCDFIGSRGPEPHDLWAIFYLGPFQRDPMWLWQGQWRLDSWQNRFLSVGLLFWSLWLGARLGYSFVGVFSRKLDGIIVPVLQKWREAGMGYWRQTLRIK